MNKMESRNITFSIVILLVVNLLLGCSPSPGNETRNGCEYSEIECLNGRAIVKLVTVRGDIIIELNGDSAPLTAGNFLDLVNRNIYDNTIFHRVVREPMPFVVQGGDPTSNDNSIPFNQLGKGGYVNPLTGRVRFIPLELKFRNEDAPRYSEISNNPSELDRLELVHERGSVAMARSQLEDSASAQFYIALKPLPELDGRYAVFGKVVNGFDVLESIRQGDKIKEVLLK
tara:strand:+ start:87 stop:773 length:687 start_codon:yes stop_codon:yes gene_type:complete